VLQLNVLYALLDSLMKTRWLETKSRDLGPWWTSNCRFIFSCRWIKTVGWENGRRNKKSSGVLKVHPKKISAGNFLSKAASISISVKKSICIKKTNSFSNGVKGFKSSVPTILSAGPLDWEWPGGLQRCRTLNSEYN